MGVSLGSVATDRITGFSGIATGRAEYLNGCVKIFVEPQSLKDGSPIEGVWFDEQRLTENSAARVGGPAALPPNA